MNCKRCGSDDVARSRRRGIWDRIQSLLGSWPYRCEDCGLRFAARYRYPEAEPNSARGPSSATPHHKSGADFRAYAAASEREGPDMAFKTHVEKPHAKIVVQADTHAQLNEILLTLNRAVNSYQDASKAGEASKTAGETADKMR